MLGTTILKKYLNSCEYIRSAVNNGIMPPQYLDMTFKWSEALGRLSTSVDPRRAIDRTLEEIHTRQQKVDVNRRRGKYMGEWNRV